MSLLCLGCGDEPAGVRTVSGLVIEVTPEAVTLPVGASTMLEASLSDLEGRPVAPREIEWSSSAPGVVSVSRTGKAVALSPGTATIGAHSDLSVGFARVLVQLDFGLPVGPAALLRAEIGSQTPLCPEGEGGLRDDGGRECSHAGGARYSLDFRAPDDMPAASGVHAAADGVVRDVCLQPPSEVTCGPDGPFVNIDHGSGFVTVYSHLDPASVAVRRKMEVFKGQAIGRMGIWGAESSPWTHFELRYRDRKTGQTVALDPLLVEGRRLADYRVAP
jgi:murein DD-endopeptidase MepM/ murein hydrolase activator NlpD